VAAGGDVTRAHIANILFHKPSHEVFKLDTHEFTNNSTDLFTSVVFLHLLYLDRKNNIILVHNINI